LNSPARSDITFAESTIRCILCGCSTQVIGEYGTYKACKCFQCGLISTDRIPEKKELLDLYSDRYYESYYNGIGYEHAYERYLKKGFRRKIKLIRRLFPSSDIRILEVGCGPGYFLRALKEKGYRNITGYEISEKAIAKAAEIGIDLEKKDILTAGDENLKYDLVISWATIEHTVDPVQYMNALMKYVRQGGYLLLDTGITGTFFDNRFKGLTPWFYPPEHLYVFTRKALMSLGPGYASRKVIINPQFSLFQRLLRSMVLIKHILSDRMNNVVQDIGLLMIKK
jgi:SAM-dependent methyltransferase